MEQNYNYYAEPVKKPGNPVTGTLGALLGAIIGAVICGVVYIKTMETNTLLGFMVGFLTITGYNLCKGRKGVYQLVICIVFVLLAVVLAEAIFYIYPIEQEYATVADMLAAVGVTEGSADYVTRAEVYQYYFELPEFWSDFTKDIGQDLLFVGATGLIAVFGIYFGNKKKAAQTVVPDLSAAQVPGQEVDSPDAEADGE